MIRIYTSLLFLAAFALQAAEVSGRYIVELTEAAVVADSRPLTRREYLESGEAVLRRQRVRGQQRLVRSQIENRSGVVSDSVDTVMNALFVRMTPEQAARLSELPGVLHVYPVREVTPHLDRANALHRTVQAWDMVGRDKAGLGIKIAIIDSGIDVEHPGFQDSSLTVPDGFPKVNDDGDKVFTNNKVIVARSYVSLLPRKDDDLSARDHSGHGTAAAMAAAGVTNQGPLASITGAAPKAFLGAYKVFGSPGQNDTSTDEPILKAIDDAVKDGMDIISMSFGTALPPRLEEDAQVAAVEKAVAAGVIVVISAGNAGPGLNTIGSPGTSPSAISVGSSWNDRIFTSTFSLEANTSPYLLVPGNGPAPQGPLAAPMVDAAQVDPSGLMCSAAPEGSLSGKIVLILRGTCFFEDKLNNAQKGGALAALVYTDRDRPDVISMDVGAATLPAGMVSYPDGADVKQRITQGTLGGTLRFDPGPFPATPDRISSFSSRGPAVNLALKPDLVAVGSSVYTAAQKFDPKGEVFNSSGYITISGTSFSAPQVAGAAAVLKQARPGLSVPQYRSLLINSATAVPLRPGTPASTLQIGAGRLTLDRALRTMAAAVPSSLSFGASDGTIQAARDIAVTNLSGTADTLTVSVVPAGGSVAPTVSTNSLAIGPGQPAALTVSLNGSQLPAGTYEGYVSLTSANSSPEIRIPYWFASAPKTPASISLLNLSDGGNAGALVNGAIWFRIVDAAGLIAAGVEPQVTVVSGGGSVVSVTDRDELSPGAYRVNVRLGARAGNNVFRVTAGDLQQDFGIPGR